jgi:hypothetical protein
MAGRRSTDRLELCSEIPPYSPSMAHDLGSHLDPIHTAVLVFECQEGVIGEASDLPTLAASTRGRDLVVDTPFALPCTSAEIAAVWSEAV